MRRQAAISANVLRGATPDHPDGTLTDLSLALIEAGNESATQGLRVEYHFASLPDTLPAAVVDAFRQASGEALANVANHAGTTRVRLTALGGSDPDRPAVTVAIVDQGKGFDPVDTLPGYGIQHSIQARMDEVGGTATVDSHPGQGTRVDLRWWR
jgi:signal transduction histidine kinase